MNSGTRFTSGSRQSFSKTKASKEGNAPPFFKILMWTVLFTWLMVVMYFLETGNFVAMLLNASKSRVGEQNGKQGNAGGVPISYIPAPSISGEVQSAGVASSDVHIIFSTDCGTYQDWQTLVVFHSATAVGQKGPITRIASGCDEEKKLVLTKLYAKLYPKYHVHFTPDFKKDEKSKKSYDFYNKPWGVKHWLEYAEPKIQDGVAIALIDPDMIIIRPIVRTIRDLPNLLYNKKKQVGEIQEEISLGSPVAQIYGLGAPWTNDLHTKFNRTRICGDGSPCLTPEREFGEMHYSVGPPYIMIKQDLLRLTETWTQFVPRVFEGYPFLLAEMYAYSMAAAHENLPHFQMYSYMVSAIDAEDEGWEHIEILDDVCVPPVDGIYFPGKPLPNVVHYCQTYRTGGIGFTKRDLPRDLFSCDKPMLVEPPRDIVTSTTRLRNGKIEKMNKKNVKRNAYMICVIHRSINAALTDYKKRMCEGQEINLEKTILVLPHG